MHGCIPVYPNPLAGRAPLCACPQVICLAPPSVSLTSNPEPQVGVWGLPRQLCAVLVLRSMPDRP